MKFFRRLYPALDYVKDNGGYLFAKDVRGMRNGTKQYFVFNSYDEFHNSKYSRTFYEVIYSYHKLYFDIDISDSIYDIAYWNKFVEDFITSIKATLKDYNVDKVNVNIYTDHRKDKFSYHIILTNIYVKNNKDAKKYAKILQKNFNHNNKQVIDIIGCYKKNQLLRVLGHGKMYDEGTKKILWKGTESFEDSLVTNLDNLQKKGSYML